LLVTIGRQTLFDGRRARYVARVERKRGRRPGEQTNIRTKLAAWRVRRGLTQDELAELAGISRSKLIRIERNPNDTDMNVRDLAQLALALGVPLDAILEPRWTAWRNNQVPLDEVRARWRSQPAETDWRELSSPGKEPTRAAAEREEKRLLRALPKRAEPLDGAWKVETAKAHPVQLDALAHAEGIRAILDTEPATAEQHLAMARSFARLAEVRELLSPPREARHRRARR
jgi:transcriptional regulator with XRE-family HTH domain